MNARSLFYYNTLSQWIPDRSASILVVAAGRTDRDVLSDLGFTNVVLSNVQEPLNGEVAPHTWSRQNAEALSYRDGEFDYTVVHAGLHHCHSPHRGLLD